MRTSFSWILLSLVTFSSVKGSPGTFSPPVFVANTIQPALGTVCPGGQTPKILSEKSIGRNQDVTVQFATCSQATPVMPRSSLVTRQTNTTNVCGATCMLARVPLVLTLSVASLTSYHRRHDKLLPAFWRWSRPQRVPCHRRCPVVR